MSIKKSKLKKFILKAQKFQSRVKIVTITSSWSMIWKIRRKKKRKRKIK